MTPTAAAKSKNGTNTAAYARLVGARSHEDRGEPEGDGETDDRHLSAHLRDGVEIKVDVTPISGHPEQGEQHEQREDEPDDLAF